MVLDILPSENLRVEDIRDTLNANGGNVGNDVVSFFGEDAKINPFSTKKPFVSAELYTDEWKSGFVLDHTLIPYRLRYELPKGGEESPYRLGDFRGYDAKVRPQLWPNELSVVVNDVDSTSGGSQELVVEIRNFKSLAKLLKKDLGIDTFLILGRTDTAKEMTLTGTSETVAEANVGMEVSSGDAFVKNPGVKNLTKYIGAFAKSSDIFPNLAYATYVFDEDTLKVNVSAMLASPTTTNPFNGQAIVPGHIVKGQLDFILAEPPIVGDYSIFYDNYIFLTWYRLESNGALTIYISGETDMAYQERLINGLFVEEKKVRGMMRLRSYYGHMGESGDVVRDGWFSTIGNANGKCEVEYYESYEGSDTFGFDYEGVFMKSIYQTPLWVIRTPYIASELTQEKNIVVTQIIPWT